MLYLYGIAAGVTFSGTQISRGSNQSINDSSITAITPTAETFDYGGWWASGTDIIVPAGAIPSGYTTIAVLVNGRLQFASNSTGVRRIFFYKNGANVAQRTVGATSGDSTDVDMFRILILAAADVITLRAEQTSGGALNVAGADITVVRYAPAA